MKEGREEFDGVTHGSCVRDRWSATNGNNVSYSLRSVHEMKK